MASVAQIQANRLNAQKSTGPRTAAGKERASQNAFKHELLAREAVIAGEDPAEFELYREGMLEELAPAGAVEAMLAESAHGGSGSPGPPKADSGPSGSPPWRTAVVHLRSALGGDEGKPIRHGSALGGDARHEEWKQVKGSAWDRGLAGVVDENLALGRVVVADFAEASAAGGLDPAEGGLMYERRIESPPAADTGRWPNCARSGRHAWRRLSRKKTRVPRAALRRVRSP